MKWILVKETEGSKPKRIYRNVDTGSECETVLIMTDQDGGKWWGFTDLFKVPIIRKAMARHITDLFGIGLSLKDILAWCQQEKQLLKSTDPEKEDKLMALILEKERLATHTADPIKQNLGLCTVYVLADEERIDYFNEQMAVEKMNLWLPFPELVAFFLNWHNGHIQRYMKALEEASLTVSNLQEREAAMRNGNLPVKP